MKKGVDKDRACCVYYIQFYYIIMALMGNCYTKTCYREPEEVEIGTRSLTSLVPEPLIRMRSRVSRWQIVIC
jgi:hypothetical protein